MGLPLYADTERLCARDYANLEHKLDRQTMEFGTQEIGSFHAFKKVQDEYGVSLYGTARVYKRSHAVCAAILELYHMGQLNFSFEIRYTETKQIGGTEYIDAADDNVIVGMAVVTTPAYPESTALLLVAEREKETVETSTQGNALTKEEDTRPIEPQERVTTEMELTMEQAMGRISELEKMTEAQTVQIAELSKAPENMVPKTMLDTAVAERDAKIASLELAVASMPALEAELATLQAANAELETVRQELDTLKQAQIETELAAKREKLSCFAAKHGLNTADAEIAQAIESADYEALVAKMMQASADEPAQTVSTASQRPMADIAVESVYGGILESKS